MPSEVVLLWRRGTLLGAFIEEPYHFGDALSTLVGPAFGGVDPSQVALPIELGEGVEELPGGRVGLDERGGERPAADGRGHAIIVSRRQAVVVRP